MADGLVPDLSQGWEIPGGNIIWKVFDEVQTFFRFSANPANFATQFASVNNAANDWTDIKFPPGADGSLDSYKDLFIQDAIDNQDRNTWTRSFGQPGSKRKTFQNI